MKGSNDAELPRFRYHPDPVASRVLEQSDAQCPCCARRRGWSYVGPRYASDYLEGLCPWCIADGSARDRFDVEFVLAMEPGASKEAVEELCHRTPCYFVAQDEPWPVHCGDFCEVVGRFEPDRLEKWGEQLETDLNALRERLDLDADEFDEYLQMDASPLWLQLLRCRSCHTPRVTGDFE